MFRRALIAVMLMSCLFLFLAMAIGRSLSQPISALTEAMTSISDGQLDTAIPFKNESGRMSRALAVLRDSGRRIVILQAEKEEAQRAIEKERLEMTTRLREQFGEVLQASSKGDFTHRVTTDLADDNLSALANTLNKFVATVDAGVSTVKEAMSPMSQGQRPPPRSDSFEGAFADMLEQVARPSETIRRQARHLEYTALHDALTGLPNRRYFELQLDGLGADKEVRGRVALLHVDLDRFKQLNDTLGHSAGDEILKHTARSLCEAARPEDFVARIGGDEFIVLCDQDVVEDLIDTVASDIVTTLSCPYVVEGVVARFGASVGVTVGSGDDVELFKNADLALYHAKKAAEVRCAFSLNRFNEILSGLDNQEFVPYFQPQVDAQTHEIVGVEALARWRHPERGVLAPIDFLSIADELNVVGRIDAQIFTAALDGVRRLIEAIVEIGRTLEIGVVAEGVETLEHVDLLTAMQCETLQGYAFAVPLSEDDLDGLIRSATMQLAS